MKRDLVISSQLSGINEVRLFLESVFLESNLNNKYFNRVFLGLSEAVNNSIVHGNKSDVSKNVFISVVYSGNRIFIEIKDEGEGFFYDSVEDPICSNNLRKEHGRGIYLIRQIADEVIFSENGRKVLISYNLS